MLLFYWCLVGSAAASVSDIELDARASRDHRVGSVKLLTYTCLLCLTILTIWRFKNRGRGGCLHESGLAVIYGLIIGAIIRYSGYESSASNLYVISDQYNASMPPENVILELYNKNVEQALESRHKRFVYEYRGELSAVYEDKLKATFDPEIFFEIILPLIIFNAGYRLERKHFFHHLGSILTYAVVGTAISSFAVGGLIYGCVQLMPDYLALDLTFRDTLFFGALISPTDPLTVLAVFAETRADAALLAVVAGESLMNDAVALVLSGTIQDVEAFQFDSNGFLTFLKATGYFVGTFTLSFLVGVFVGCLTWPTLETSLVILMSYASYLTAEVCHLTGVVSILFCGICQSHYTYKNLSEEARASTGQVSGLFNFIAESFTFAYVGVSMVTFARHRFDQWFILAGFLCVESLATFYIVFHEMCSPDYGVPYRHVMRPCGIGRIVSVYPLSWLMNSIRTEQIPWNYQHMLVFAGLRGAMSFALAIRNTLSEARQCILTTTSLIVIFSVIVQGGATRYMLKLLDIPVDLPDETNTNVTTTNTNSARVKWNVHASSVNLPSHIDNNVNFSSRVKSILEKRTWAFFDARYLQPLLTWTPRPCTDALLCSQQPDEGVAANNEETADDDCREGEAVNLVAPDIA